MQTRNVRELHRASTGIRGLDEILNGGFRRRRLYLIEGEAGTGKTTLGLQFLNEGLSRGERGLYVTLSQSQQELGAVARAHGWSMFRHLDVCELEPVEPGLDCGSPGSLETPDPAANDVEDVIERIVGVVAETKPQRVVVDTLSELRAFYNDPGQFHRHVVALKNCLSKRACTTLFLDGPTGVDAETLAHGVLRLEQLPPEYGPQRRRMWWKKLREPSFRDGYHDYALGPRGLDVYPRLTADAPADPALRFGAGATSGLPELDAMVGGDLDRATSTLFFGPAGVGKSTMTMHFVEEAARRGERSAVFLFEESAASWLARAEALSLELARYVTDGTIALEHVHPSRLSPGQFSYLVSKRVDEKRCLLVIDSLNGLELAMPCERQLALHLHELLEHVGQRGVTTLLTLEQRGLMDAGSSAAVWFMADNAVVLRYLDAAGAPRRGVSMVKRRAGNHESGIREFEIRTGAGVCIGSAVSDARGPREVSPEFRRR